MDGPLGIYSPNLDPLSALGIEARTDEERRRYAELQVQVEARRVEKLLAYQRAYDEAWQRLNPGMQRVNLPDDKPGAGPSSSPLRGSGRMAVFVKDGCAACGQLVQRLQSRARSSTCTWWAAARMTRASATGPSARRSTRRACAQHHAQPRRRPLAVTGPARRSARRRARSERPMAAPAVAMPLRALVLTAGLYAVAALAQEVPPPAYQLAAQRAGIPSTVLYAVALQESGIRRNGRLVPWPWSLNVAGQSRRFATRADACAGLQQAMRATPHTRIDAGLGQINLGYHKHRFTGACDLLDPYRNLAVAAEILKEQHTPARTGCWRSAATTARRRRARRPLSAQRVAPPCPRAGRDQPPRSSRRARRPPMTKPHPAHLAFTGLLMLLSGLPLASRAGEPLIVVEDRGGTSALPYYEALNLQPRANAPARPSIPTPQVPATRADEAAMLPVRSAKLTPGTVARR